MTQRDEAFISIDIETDGPCPGLNSMLALGAAAFHSDGSEIGTWYAKLEPLPGAIPDPETMIWWMTQPAAWDEVIKDREAPDDAMNGFDTWLNTFRKKELRITAVAWPAAFDFAFVNYYLWLFVKRNLFGFSCTDIRSYMNGLAKYPSYQGLPRKEGKKLTGPVNKTGLRPHFAVDDAVEQGRTFMALRAYAMSQGTCDGGC